MREAGFEPTTSASGGQRSIQLSYSRAPAGRRAVAGEGKLGGRDPRNKRRTPANPDQPTRGMRIDQSAGVTARRKSRLISASVPRARSSAGERPV